jgi:transcriptional regulator with XRE-family HTH domain
MNLKSLRTKMDLTQKQLAEKMDTTQQTFARWETGKTPLNAANIQRLCGILKCTAQELMGWENESDDEPFDRDNLLEVGIPFGTLKLGMTCGAQEFPIGNIAKDDVDAFLDRHSAVNRSKDGREWMVLTTLRRRLLLINFAAVQTVGLISNDVEAMPAYEDDDVGSTVVEAHPQADRNGNLEGIHRTSHAMHDEIQVTFLNGKEETYLLTDAVAHEVYCILMAGDVRSGSVLMIEDEEAGQQRTYVQLSEVAMIDLPVELFAELTNDD